MSLSKKDVINSLEQYALLFTEEKFTKDILGFVKSEEDFWQRENIRGHITASTWVINEERTKVLLTYHKKLNIWVQLGGHIEIGDDSMHSAALRELREESGLSQIRSLSQSIYDLDIHKIPISKNGFPAHYHYDIRYLFQANEEEAINFDLQESNKVAWISIEKLEDVSNETSLLRMREKLIQLQTNFNF